MSMDIIHCLPSDERAGLLRLQEEGSHVSCFQKFLTTLNASSVQNQWHCFVSLALENID